MNKINKENIKKFAKYYHYFHDSYIEEIKYHKNNSTIEILIMVYWSGTPYLKEDGSYESNKTNIKMIFKNIKSYGEDKNRDSDNIDDVILDYFKIDNQELIGFSIFSGRKDEEPYFYVLSEKLEYKEIGMIYIPEEHKKYDVLPNCRKYNVEMIIRDDTSLKKIKELSGMSDFETNPYQRYKSYQDFYEEMDSWIKKFPKYKKEIIEYKNSVKKLNNKDLWAIVEYIGESNWSFTKNKYYYVVMYIDNNSWKIDGVIDNEEYNSFIVWSPKCTNPVDLANDFKIVVDPSNNLKNEFIKIMHK